MPVSQTPEVKEAPSYSCEIKVDHTTDMVDLYFHTPATEASDFCIRIRISRAIALANKITDACTPTPTIREVAL